MFRRKEVGTWSCGLTVTEVLLGLVATLTVWAVSQ